MKDRASAWITGANGLIGSELIRSAERHAPSIAARGITRPELDLLDSKSVEGLFHREKPDLVIHCAAVSRNPICQASPELAYASNVAATERLAELASAIPFVFLSTDLVFDGTKGGYLEEDEPNPLSVYGETKAAAEQIVRKHPEHMILRLSLTGGHSRAGDRGFNEELKNAWRDGKWPKLFTDEYRCPCSAESISRAVWELVRINAQGTFHLCGGERLSRYEIGKLLAGKHQELNPKLIVASRKEYQGPPRPADTSMSCAKAQKLLPFQLPRFSEWLEQDLSGF